MLANRLTRASRWREAEAYLDEKDRGTLRDYAHAIRSGYDKERDREERAEHFWIAATLAMTQAQPLLAFYAEPPYHVEDRHWIEAEYARHRPKAELGRLNALTADERERLADTAGEFVRDRHAAFIAAAHAWRACELMPDNDDRTAYRLTIAGNWIMYRDPKAADRFYKALATRCPKTELGRKAIEKRWFPKLTDDPLYLTK